MNWAIAVFIEIGTAADAAFRPAEGTGLRRWTLAVGGRRRSRPRDAGRGDDALARLALEGVEPKPDELARLGLVSDGGPASPFGVRWM